MKLLKQLTLFVTSLLVIAFSFSSAKPSDPSKSIKNKSIECHFTALADDDIDDDLIDREFQLACTHSYDCVGREKPATENFQYTSGIRLSSLPCYLKIRSLRI